MLMPTCLTGNSWQTFQDVWPSFLCSFVCVFSVKSLFVSFAHFSIGFLVTAISFWFVSLFIYWIIVIFLLILVTLYSLSLFEIFLTTRKFFLFLCRQIYKQFMFLGIVSSLERPFSNLYFYWGNGNPLQYSCLETPMDRGAWWAEVHGVAKSQTRLSDFTFTFHFHAWRRKWQPTPLFLPGESQGLQNLVGCRLWGHTESDMTEAT